MSQEQPQKPVTYKDIFGDSIQGEVAEQPVTIEDAALMQSAESHALGKTSKGGAASIMQSAANKNVQRHMVDPTTHSEAAERGFGIRETFVDGKVCREEFVGQESVYAESTFVATLSELAAKQGITIGEALEEAAHDDSEKIVDKGTARAIQSAEARATGGYRGFEGGLGASAQSAAQKNAEHGTHITLFNVLDGATEKMLVDKVVMKDDVEKVKQVTGDKDEGSVIISAFERAVDANSNADKYLQNQYTKHIKADPEDDIPHPHAEYTQTTPKGMEGTSPSKDAIPHAHAD
ncbi:hypothetical protein KP509_27G059700 [Ceratopteris richardii]|uniref:SMP domain-containing protein n=1 Tax=Ceratopteris richardii TaxID=49495 RepID=A0A8T2RGX6_CERRI|nr:hypothetical protein KP509_27G059700 [Ceratopteris richardii]